MSATFAALLGVAAICCSLASAAPGFDTNEEEAAEAMRNYNAKNELLHRESGLAAWLYDSNITDANSRIKNEVVKRISKESKALILGLQKYDWKTLQDPDLRRQFRITTVLGSLALPEDKFNENLEVTEKMSTIFATAKVCDYRNPTKCDLRLDPELTEIFVRSRDPDELKHYWVSWRDAAGKKCRELYKKYIELKVEESKVNGYDDPVEYWNMDFFTGYDDPVEYWNMDFESNSFTEDIMKLWDQLLPFYQQLHAFVRYRLNKKYGDEVVSKNGPIPAHLLGNMWAQLWANVNDIVNPFYVKNKETATDEMIKQKESNSLGLCNTWDFGAGNMWAQHWQHISSIVNPFYAKNKETATDEMVEQGYTPVKMARLAEDFFKSINLTAMPKEFWENSILERPTDREMVCHASAWDMYNGNDFRIKMCTRVNEEDLQVLHHEMGHVQYYIQYKEQPVVYRQGANSGFHEAIGDTIALNVKTDQHMHKIGLKDATPKTYQATIRDLLDTALDKVAFLPFAFMVDQYRWDLLQGKISLDDMECGWWRLREKFQGLEPPVDRSEDDFDPAAKYHVVADVPYIRYFVSFVIQFQFYKALCVEAGQYDPKAPEKNPLHECDIYGSAPAGNLLGRMLKMGGSKPWPEAMEVVTGQRNMDAGPLMEYFKPLMDWLVRENSKNNVKPGWEPTTRNYCTKM